MANYPAYPYYQQGYTQPFPPQGNVYGGNPQNVATAQFNAVRTVYSEAEARAAQIPTDGSTVYFSDPANGCIYTKQFSFENGSFLFAVYRQAAEKPAVEYATKEDLRLLREEIMKKGAEAGE